MIVIVVLCALLVTARAFNTPFARIPRTFAKKCDSQLTRRMAVIDDKSEEGRYVKIDDPLKNFNFEEAISPLKIDRSSVLFLLSIQAILLATTAVVGDFLHILPSPIYAISGFPSFDAQGMVLALQFTIPMIVGGLVLDNLPYRPFQAIRRDTRILLLRLFGRTTPSWAVFATSVLLSGAAGFAEEFAFRGFFFNIVASSYGLTAGTLVSSLLFGLAHFPLFGVSTLVETLLGLVFALAYIASGFNIAVPIAIHTMYDLAVLFITWLSAKEDLAKRVKGAKERLKADQLDENLPKEFAIIALGVFDTIDTDGDGFINEAEFTSAMKAFNIL
ncbi:hypothetical protein B484DRAFT_167357 [Ochromonadaceae sp. CCMP2298]|nr:hypothetical protein B484DRAFT_167357 [Ochromonadaceae sp. CCMP2298]